MRNPFPRLILLLPVFIYLLISCNNGEKDKTKKDDVINPLKSDIKNVDQEMSSNFVFDFSGLDTKGKVLSVTTAVYNAIDDNGTIKGGSKPDDYAISIELGEFDFWESDTEIPEKGAVEYKRTYSYDKNGNCKEIKKYYSDGRIKQISSLYNDNNQLLEQERNYLEEIEKNKPIRFMAYSPTNNIIDKVLKSTCKYDKKGNLIEISGSYSIHEPFYAYDPLIKIANEYDRNNVLKKTVKFDSKNNIEYSTSFEYNTFLKIKREYGIDANKDTNYWREVDYYQNGTIRKNTERRDNGSDIRITDFDNKGIIRAFFIEVQSVGGARYFYDKMGNLTLEHKGGSAMSGEFNKAFIYNDKGRIIEEKWFIDSELYKITYAYDSEGNITEVNEMYFVDQVPEIEEKESGNFIRETEYFPDGSENIRTYKKEVATAYGEVYEGEFEKGWGIESQWIEKEKKTPKYTKTYKLEYDDEGNWIKAVYYSDGKAKLIIERDIKYLE